MVQSLDRLMRQTEERFISLGKSDVHFPSREQLLRAMPGNVMLYHGSGDLGSTTVGAASLTCSASSQAPALGGNHPYLYVGTSGWIAHQCETTASSLNAGVFTIMHPYCNARKGLAFIQAVPTTTSGGAVEWFREAFSLRYQDFSDAFELKAKDPKHVGSLLFLPHLAGERAPEHDPAARGAFIGIGLDTTKSDMSLAVLQGLCFHFRWMHETLKNATAEPSTDASNVAGETKRTPMPLLMVGGGSKSIAWCQITSDILGVPVLALKQHGVDMAALGAACIATGADAPFEIKLAQSGNLATQSFLPRPHAVEIYSQVYHIWRRAYTALREVNLSLVKLAKQGVQ
jgi:xylulokinase